MHPISNIVDYTHIWQWFH